MKEEEYTIYVLPNRFQYEIQYKPIFWVISMRRLLPILQFSKRLIMGEFFFRKSIPMCHKSFVDFTEVTSYLQISLTITILSLITKKQSSSSALRTRKLNSGVAFEPNTLPWRYSRSYPDWESKLVYVVYYLIIYGRRLILMAYNIKKIYN